jgi:hypothetical protein
LDSYIVTIFDIKNIAKPKQIDEVTVKADDKASACDKAHTVAEKMYPEVKRMIETRKA